MSMSTAKLFKDRSDYIKMQDMIREFDKKITINSTPKRLALKSKMTALLKEMGENQANLTRNTTEMIEVKNSINYLETQVKYHEVLLDQEKNDKLIEAEKQILGTYQEMLGKKHAKLEELTTDQKRLEEQNQEHLRETVKKLEEEGFCVITNQNTNTLFLQEPDSLSVIDANKPKKIPTPAH